MKNLRMYSAPIYQTFQYSTDGGLNWSFIGHADLGLRSLAIHPTDPTIIYAGSASNGVYKFIWE